MLHPLCTGESGQEQAFHEFLLKHDKYDIYRNGRNYNLVKYISREEILTCVEHEVDQGALLACKFLDPTTGS